MKTIKTLLAVLTLILSISSVFTVNSFAKPKVIEFHHSSPSNYIEYKEIDGILWQFTYNDSGVLIDQRPVFD
jgi:hypothetical protein